MSNKLQLQTNNIDLQSILSTVLGLPTQESCKNGAYVWKKYNYSIKPSIVANNQDLDSDGFYIYNSDDYQVTASDFSLRVLDGGQTVGTSRTIYFTYTDKLYWSYTKGGTDDYQFTVFTHSDNLAISAYNYRCNFTGLTSIKFTEPTKGDFVDFVVSDNESAYPDGGTQDGYWYEKLVEVDILYKGFAELKGYSKIAKDTFIYSNDLSISTSDSSPTKFSHSLGETPKAVMVIADRFKKTTSQTSSTYHQLLIACLQQDKTNTYSICAGVVWRCNDSSLDYPVSGVNGIKIKSLSNSQVQVYFTTASDGNNYPVLCAGVEYTLITMA